MVYPPNSKHKRNFQMAQWFYWGEKELLGKDNPQCVGERESSENLIGGK